MTENFRTTYGDLLTKDISRYENGFTSFHSLLNVVKASGHKLYLFIDEYDNFGNEVMMGSHGENVERYQDLMSGEGLFKTLFKNVKSAGSGEGLDRVFMTGVSPIVMNDATSGANTVEAISWAPEKTREALELMQIFYNGSYFDYEASISGSGPNRDTSPSAHMVDNHGIYNPTLVFYFLKHLQRYRRYPREMLDSNLAPDYNKLVYISRHPNGQELLTNAFDEQATISVPTLNERFGMPEMLEIDKGQERLAVLLCYLGALTIGGTTAVGNVMLRIPNLVMRRLYGERILELVFPNAETRTTGRDAANHLFGQGEIDPLCEFIENYYMTVYNTRDSVGFNELTVKTLFLTTLQHNELYIMDSEVALQQRYADLIMLIRPEMRHFQIFDLLIEFKCVSLKELNKSTKTHTTESLSKLSVEELLALKPVQTKINKAQTQLNDYHQTLNHKYGDALKLRSYVVIAIGLGRLIGIEYLAAQSLH